MEVDAWAQQRSGDDCYLCPPRLATHSSLTFIADLSVARLYLERDQRFRGLSCLVLNEHATNLDQLADVTYRAFMHDLRSCLAAIREVALPDHMNVASLGNSCPHLHWSIVPRYRTDPVWGKPVWNEAILHEMSSTPVQLPTAEQNELIDRLRKRLVGGRSSRRSQSQIPYDDHNNCST